MVDGLVSSTDMLYDNGKDQSYLTEPAVAGPLDSYLQSPKMV